ncbi:MAG: AhpC/TSA family protein [Bacteroidales bacterium]|nr:AhpC/TSA family protein [Bacteroidales bacterium]
MRSFSLFAAASVAAAATVLSACGSKAVINGEFTDGYSGEVVVKLLDVNRFEVLDTLSVKDGRFDCQVNVEKGQPEFIYLFRGEEQLVSMILEQGDKVKVELDSMGFHNEVSGSAETLKLHAVENSFSAFSKEVGGLSAKMASLTPGSEEAAIMRAELAKRYIAYYRDRLSYVLKNSRSLTVVPVLFQQLDGDVPVFSQKTDAIIFRNTCDSLKEVYPDSRYVKALEREADRRQKLLELDGRLKDAEVRSFADIELPGMDGSKVKLSEVQGKLVMLYFWASSAEQKMFNIDTLLPLYRQYHPKGLEIYAVSLDVDKGAWASAVKTQALPWINVCDTRGAASVYAGVYNVQTLPTAVFILDGTVDYSAKVGDDASLRSYIASKL